MVDPAIYIPPRQPVQETAGGAEPVTERERSGKPAGTAVQLATTTEKNMDGAASKRVLCCAALVCCWGTVAGTPALGELTLRKTLKQLRFSCSVSAALADDNVKQKPGTYTLQIWQMSKSGERRVWAHMSTSESARVTGNLVQTGAEATGSWAAGTPTLTLTVSASQDVRGLGSYGCSLYYYARYEERYADSITVSVNVTGDKKHYTSDPLGLEITAEFHYFLSGGCCFKDPDVIYDASIETILVSSDVTGVCPGILYFNPIAHAASGTVKPVKAMYMRLGNIVPDYVCVFSIKEPETWICNLQQLHENSGGEPVSPGSVALYVFIAILAAWKIAP